MTTINNTATSASLLGSTSTSSSATSATTATDDPNSVAATQDRFLTLLVTQMQNQDPLNPMDNAAVTSQLAQLSTVNGIDKLNTTLTALQGSYQSSQSLQAASLIGHGVLVPGSATTLTGGNAVFGVDVTQAADDVKITIQDASGKAIHTMDLGAQAVGTLPLTWDGKTDTGATAPDGQYTFAVAATNAGAASTATALSYGQVGSVSSNAQGVKLNIAGQGAVDLASVRQFLQ